MADANLEGVRNAVAAGWHILKNGGSALDAVEEAVVIMENDETFDAGRGSFLNSAGKVQLDAFIMDGATLRAGGVGCVERLRNPVRAARKILNDSIHVYFVGAGAERFASEQGLLLCDNDQLIIRREIDRLREFQSKASPQSMDLFDPARSHDTVGAVALDCAGNLAVATSTGGTINKAPGRLGDSSLIGCGCYADNATAAASATGWGEPIMRLVLAKWATDRVPFSQSPQQEVTNAIKYLKTRLDGYGGMILLDASGNFGIAHNTSRMAWASRTPQEEKCGIESPQGSLQIPDVPGDVIRTLPYGLLND